MKKLIETALMLLIVLSISVLACADDLETEKTIDVEVEVDGVFGFRINSDEYDQTLYPGSALRNEQLGELHIEVTTNRGAPWSIQAECPGLVGGNQTGYGSSGVPLIMSTYATGGGTTVTDMELTAHPKSIYTSSSSEWFARELLIHGAFEVRQDVVSNLVAGTYRGFITLTMTGSVP